VTCIPVLLLLAPLAVPQEPVPAPPPPAGGAAEVATRLRERSDAWSGFHVEYRLEGLEEGASARLILDYRAPDRAQLRFDSSQGRAGTALDRGEMLAILPLPSGMAWARVPLQELFDATALATAPLLEELGGGTESAAEPGVSITLQVLPDAGGGARLNFDLAWHEDALQDGKRRRPLLAWLEDFLEPPYTATVVDGALRVTTENGVTLHFQKDDPFPVLLERRTPQGPRRMERVSFEILPAEAPLETPSPEALREAGAQDVSLPLGLQLFHRIRTERLSRLAELLASAGETELRARWREYVSALHEAAVPVLWAPWKAEARARIEGSRRGLLAAAGGSPERSGEERDVLRGKVAELREQMLAAARNHAANLAPAPLPEGLPVEELLEIERQVLAGLVETRLAAWLDEALRTGLLEPLRLEESGAPTPGEGGP